MSSKHTPGPWELRWSDREGYWFLDHQQGGEGYTLAIVKEVEEADAALIAAAPELLEALERIVGNFDRGAKETAADRLGGIGAARAAIARAKGE